MKITKERTGGVMTVALEGRLDSTGALELEEALWEDEKKQFLLSQLTELTLDFSKLEYISSAGLRVLRNLYVETKYNNYQFKITNVNEIVREIFDVTGFSDLLTIC